MPKFLFIFKHLSHKLISGDFFQIHILICFITVQEQAEQQLLLSRAPPSALEVHSENNRDQMINQ